MTSEEEYETILINGQRIFRPANPTFLTSPIYDDVKNHEIFLDNLPRDCFEEELLPFLCRIGPVYQVRIMMAISGLTRGMAFVVYSKVEDSFRAVEQLNGQLIRKGHPAIQVKFSANNRRLHIKKIPLTIIGGVTLQKHLNLIGVMSIKLFPSDDKLYNEAIIVFENHHLASSARRRFVAKYFKINDSILEAHWAKPKDFQTLYVEFNKTVDESIIRLLFENNDCLIYKIIPRVSTTFQSKKSAYFIKYKAFSMANMVRKFYSNYQFPLVWNGVEILKVDWPDRKSI